MILNNSKIQTKLILGFSIMIFFIIMIGIIGYYKFSKIKKDLDEIFLDTMPGSTLLLEMDRDLYQTLVAERTLIFTELNSEKFNHFIGEYENNLKQSEDRFNKFVVLASSEQEKKLIEEYRIARQAWLDISAEVLALCKDSSQTSRKTAGKLSLSDAAVKFEFMRDKIDKLVGISYDFTELIDKRATKTEQSGKYLIVISIITGVLLGILFSLLISTGILTSIKSAIIGFKDIADGKGDLTKRMKIKTNDEVAELAEWFNRFIDNLQKDFIEFSTNARNLNQSSHKLTDFASQLTENTGNMTTYANNVAASTEQMSTNLSGIASTMEQITSGTESVATASKEMSSTINEIAKNAEIARTNSMSSVKQTQNTSSKMQTLNDHAKSISKITETIQNISDQINLLSLNATIEAARAGSAGKGFAVVASEIKDLSVKTAKATEEIAEQIKNIQTTTVETASEIEKILKEIDNISSTVTQIATSAEEQNAVTKEIVSNISRVSSGMKEINQRINQNSQVSQTIAADISSVGSSANTLFSGSSQLKNSAAELSKTADTITSVVNRFKTE